MASNSVGEYQSAQLMAETRPGEDARGHCPDCKELMPVGWEHYRSSREEDICHVFLVETGLEIFTLRRTRHANWALVGTALGS